MKEIRDLSNVDIYVIDQLLKGAIRKDQRILDAGCGSGRNFSFLAKHEFNITGIDPNQDHIRNLKSLFPDYSHQLHISTIEEFQPAQSYDYIICNAVLHFANNHNHFDQMFEQLIHLLERDGVLFIRMTTNQGLEVSTKETNGLYNLPDQSARYLITRRKLAKLCEAYNLVLEAPFKTVLVEQLRSMATIVLRKEK